MHETLLTSNKLNTTAILNIVNIVKSIYCYLGHTPSLSPKKANIQMVNNGGRGTLAPDWLDLQPSLWKIFSRNNYFAFSHHYWQITNQMLLGFWPCFATKGHYTDNNTFFWVVIQIVRTSNHIVINLSEVRQPYSLVRHSLLKIK